jgi:hypothetical protein
MTTIAAIVALLDELETIADTHDELWDTDVREAMAVALNEYFVLGQPYDTLPVRYSMFSRAGDELIAAAMARFLERVAAATDLAAFTPGQPRLDLLQSTDAVSSTGKFYDEFWGHVEAPLERGAVPPLMFTPREDDEDDDHDPRDG